MATESNTCHLSSFPPPTSRPSTPIPRLRHRSYDFFFLEDPIYVHTLLQVKVKAHFSDPLEAGQAVMTTRSAGTGEGGGVGPISAHSPEGGPSTDPGSHSPEEKLTKCLLHKQHFAKWLPWDTRAVRRGVWAIACATTCALGCTRKEVEGGCSLHKHVEPAGSHVQGGLVWPGHL